MIEIVLFGEPEVRVDGQAMRIPRKKSRALLYYLAAHKKPQRREHLQALFWPESARESSQQLLRTTLYSLRSILGDAIKTDFDMVSLDDDIWIDARILEDRLETSTRSDEVDKLQSALNLYQGDFLEGFSLPDTTEYDNWSDTEREYFRKLAAQSWVTLSKLYEQQGSLPEALAALDQALAFDPLQEDLQRQAIQLAYLAGNRPNAIRRYDELRQLLDSELGVPPMLATRLMYDAILKDEQEGARAPTRSQENKRKTATIISDSLPFTGRSRELEELREAASADRFLLITGEPGIGKTRLAEEFIRRSSGLAARGTAHELEQNLPYQVAASALQSLTTIENWQSMRQQLDLSPIWRRELDRLVPGLFPEMTLQTSAAEAGAESRLWEAVYQLLLSISQHQQIVWFIDDLQWADNATLGLLGYLARREKSKITMLATARQISNRSQAATLIQSLTRVDRMARIELARLSAAEVLLASGKLTKTPSPMLSQWLVERSEGNPYILVELVRSIRSQGVFDQNGELDVEKLSKVPVVPQSVYSLVASRLSILSDTARRMLDAAVAVGRDFELVVTAHAAGLSTDAGVDAIDELQVHGLIHPMTAKSAGDAARYTFDHNLTIEVACQEVGEARHRLMHRRVAEAIEQLHRRDLDEWAGVLAFHFLETGDHQRAASYAYRAGKRAARLSAWKEATAFYEQALLGVTDRDREREIWTALGEVRTLAGASVRASQAYEQAIHLAAPGSREVSALKLELAYTFLTQARFTEAIGLAREVLTEASGDASRAEFLWGTALSLEGADLDGATLHLKLAEKYCDPTALLRLAEIQFELGSIAAQQGDLDEAVDLYQRSLEWAKQAYAVEQNPEQSLMRLILAYNNLAYHLHLLKRPEAEEYAVEGMQLARDKGAVSLQPYLYSTNGEILLANGRIDEAEVSFREGLALAERISFPERIAGLTANLGLVAIKKGQVSTAIHRLSKAMVEADALGTHHLAAQIRIWLAPLLPPEDARAYLREARVIAENGGRSRLLREIDLVEKTLN